MSFFQIVQGDALAVMSTIEDNSVDLVVSDPAYCSLEKHRSVGTTTRLAQSDASSNEWFPVVSNDYLVDYARECYRIMKPGTHGYILCDQDTGFFLKPELERIGFFFWRVLTWDKESLGMGYHYRCRSEWVLFFEKVERKGKHRQLNDLSVPDIISVKSLRGKQYYPTEKPVQLLELFIGQSTQPGQAVFDGFCGSGSTGEAALNLGRNVILCDLQPSAVHRADSRLMKIGTQKELVIPRSQMALAI
ncbi:DNA-methyltransferase [Rheinheimera hassiensis]|uniref:DNA-methyltransferase n=1 Tax=Rheinheimera hassiensis TaxID=1193627 RepID=UPI001F0654DC|nr:site-specific DNA-methyltransferase [Rheinheimera hassiensis]